MYSLHHIMRFRERFRARNEAKERQRRIDDLKALWVQTINAANAAAERKDMKAHGARLKEAQGITAELLKLENEVKA